MASKKSEEDAFLLSLESIDDSWVLDSSSSSMLHLIKVTSLIMSKGILGLFIWGIMNLVIFLEREKLRLGCRIGFISYYMR